MPVCVNNGLWLEDRNAWLRWRSSLDELLADTSPDYCTVHDDRKTLVWNDSAWGAMPCQVTTIFGGSWRPQSVMLGLRIEFDTPDEVRSLPAGFKWLQGKLDELFGKPGMADDNGEEGKAVWMLGAVTMRHEYFDGMGGGHCLILLLSSGPAT
jgi:hypothetical protein